MTDHETIDPVAREISKAARIAEAIVSGKADLAEARGLSARDLNYVYSCAYTYYQSGD
ncbi:MAG: hypothetical protein QG656_1021, partial [Candidatus Hydrogenedentes bacterium]|nr:hypothetical protein [Candidatus Hydrogenedentota bacterium]